MVWENNDEKRNVSYSQHNHLLDCNSFSPYLFITTPSSYMSFISFYLKSHFENKNVSNVQPSWFMKSMSSGTDVIFIWTQAVLWQRNGVRSSFTTPESISPDEVSDLEKFGYPGDDPFILEFPWEISLRPKEKCGGTPPRRKTADSMTLFLLIWVRRLAVM